MPVRVVESLVGIRQAWTPSLPACLLKIIAGDGLFAPLLRSLKPVVIRDDGGKLIIALRVLLCDEVSDAASLRYRDWRLSRVRMRRIARRSNYLVRFGCVLETDLLACPAQDPLLLFGFERLKSGHDLADRL
jgi:hypothetical protein